MQGLKHRLVVAVATAGVFVAPPVAAADREPAVVRPPGPNPYLSLVADPSRVDYGGWRRHLTQQAKARANAASSASAPPLVVSEAEPPGVRGDNDSVASAQLVPGVGTGPGQAPRARITGRLSSEPDARDLDFYRVELRAGDVLGAKVQGAGRRLTILDPAGVEVHGSAFDDSVFYPTKSPLPGGGNAVVDHVAAVSGPYYLAVTEGSGDYEVTVGTHRPPLERELTPQIVFLDFDGAQLNVGIFGEPPGIRTLSAFRPFLNGWGLTEADEPAVVRKIVATVRENLVEDVRARSNNPNARLLVFTSLDHPELWGQPNVSRVVIGGTSVELGVPGVVGGAESIDPGNFVQEETAVVMFDLLTAPAGPPTSLNTFLTPQSNRIEFIGRAIGNIVAHEIGHYIGNYHTEALNPTASLMDGGTVRRLLGVGDDNVGGTADDTDVDLTADVFDSFERHTGVEDTLNRTAFGLSTFRLN